MSDGKAYVPGTPCTLNSKGDLMMDGEAKHFIGEPCYFVKMTKGGLVQVQLQSDPRRVVSVPARNVDLI